MNTKDLFIFCTCAETNKKIYLKRIKNWYEQIKELDADFYVFVDGEITEEDKKDMNKNIIFINLIPKLGRKSICEFPGWKRSFREALKKSLNYKYCLHIESDTYIKNLNNLKKYLYSDGNYISRCNPYYFNESNVMILNDINSRKIFINFYENENNLTENNAFELSILSHINFNIVWKSVRYEGNKNRIKGDEDFICQYY